MAASGGAKLSASLVPAVVRPRRRELDELAKLLNGSERVTLLCGRGCFGAHTSLMRLADMLKSPIARLPGKDGVEWDNPFDVGMTGLIGFPSGYHAMLDCDRLLMLGTDSLYRQFCPRDARVAQVDLRAQSLRRHCRVDHGLIREVGVTIEALLPPLDPKTDCARLDDSLANYHEAREDLDDLATGRAGGELHPHHVAKVLSEAAMEDAAFTFDVGTELTADAVLFPLPRAPQRRRDAHRGSGGLSYGAICAGPIGLILDPTFSAKKYSKLLFAFTLKGSCSNVCPVKTNIRERIAAWHKALSEMHELSVLMKTMMKAASVLLARACARRPVLPLAQGHTRPPTPSKPLADTKEIQR